MRIDAFLQRLAQLYCCQPIICEQQRIWHRNIRQRKGRGARYSTWNIRYRIMDDAMLDVNRVLMRSGSVNRSYGAALVYGDIDDDCAFFIVLTISSVTR